MNPVLLSLIAGESAKVETIRHLDLDSIHSCNSELSGEHVLPNGRTKSEMCQNFRECPWQYQIPKVIQKSIILVLFGACDPHWSLEWQRAGICMRS